MRTYSRSEHDGAIYADPADDKWRAVRIDAGGWRSCPSSSAVPPFRAGASAGAERGGSLDELRRFVNVTDEECTLLAA